MPGETVACIVVLDDIIAVTDGELERDHTVATIRIGEEPGGCGSGGTISLSVPNKAVACGLDVDIEGTIMDGEVEGVNISAGRVETMVVGIGSAGCVDAAVPVVAIACHDMEGSVVLGIDDEMERVGARASVGIGVVVGVDAVSGIGGAVPCEALTCCLVVAVVRAAAYGEVQIDREIGRAHV